MAVILVCDVAAFLADARLGFKGALHTPDFYQCLRPLATD